MKQLQADEIRDIRCHELLAYATSRVEQACERYLTHENWQLYGYETDGRLTGVIGIELTAPDQAIIQQIAVAQEARAGGIGRALIDGVRERVALVRIEAETDRDAVHFYKKYGFVIESLGEKYPGVERFRCVFGQGE